MYDARTGNILFYLGDRFEKNAVTALARSHDGSSLAVGFSDGNIRIWLIATQTENVCFRYYFFLCKTFYLLLLLTTTATTIIII